MRAAPRHDRAAGDCFRPYPIHPCPQDTRVSLAPCLICQPPLRSRMKWLRTYRMRMSGASRMLRSFRYFAVLVLAWLGVAETAVAGKRVALVVGNSAYKYAPQLGNPRNDATDIVAELKKFGFEVIEGRDLDKAGMDRTIHQFARALSGAEVGLFFYAGHGLQVGGQNYIVPVDAKLEDASGLDFETIRLDLVQRTMERETRANVLFLDACRDNPLARNLARAMGTRSGQIGRGLATMEAGVGTLISFSTQPGNVALDGGGRNSPFASALVKQLAGSKEDLSTLLIKVRNDVLAATNDRQVPWEHSALRAKFYFREAPSPASEVPLSTMPTYEQQAELSYWNTIKDLNDQLAFRSYLDHYPNGAFSKLAAVLLEKVKREADQKAVITQKDTDLKKADEAQRAARAKQLESDRLASEAKQAGELKSAREEAKMARLALAAADKEREAARKAAEEAHQALDRMKIERELSTKSGSTAEVLAPADSPNKVVAIAVVPTSTESSLSPEHDQVTLARKLQLELKRVGCDPGVADGKWGEKAKRALEQFGRFASVSILTDEPSAATFEIVVGKKGRICPVQCSAGEIETNGKCVAMPKLRPQETSKDSSAKSAPKAAANSSIAPNPATPSSSTYGCTPKPNETYNEKRARWAHC